MADMVAVAMGATVGEGEGLVGEAVDSEAEGEEALGGTDDISITLINVRALARRMVAGIARALGFHV